MPERKVPLGVAEADALAAWLERVSVDYAAEDTLDPRSVPEYFQLMRDEARAWADAVRPVKIGGVVMKEGK